MKKTIIKTVLKTIVCVLSFLIALFVSGRVMNKGHSNMTMEMPKAVLPIVSMEQDGVRYNELHGYVSAQDIAFQRDCVTTLGENRETSFVVDTYGAAITGIRMEVRSLDGTRLVEETAITGYRQEGRQIRGQLALKDLIERNEEYSLTVTLSLEGYGDVFYYTRVIWGENLCAGEKLAFVQDFHDRLYDKEQARELTKYLESNSQLESNRSFHKVNIHSSFHQITWGELQVRQEGAASCLIKEITDQTGSFVMDYLVSTPGTEERVYYQVKEYFRVRYTPERMYLLNYERTMTQIPDPAHMYGGDKILFGITSEEVPMLESADGNIVVFETAGQLCSYNATTSRLAAIFSFYDRDNWDARTRYDQHGIKILDVDEGGNVSFAVYGYMNRGRHEGEVGIQIYTYDSTLNTLEEAVYIPYDKSFALLGREMEQLLYMNREQTLYLLLQSAVYRVSLTERTAERLVLVTQDDTLHISDSHKIIVWQEGTDTNHCRVLNMRNLNTDAQYAIQVPGGEVAKPLGFMGEDVIYGVALEEDVREESSGSVFFPMYRICICDEEGRLLKEYQQDDVYVTKIELEDNQITLERVKRTADGSYQDEKPDHIMSSVEHKAGKNQVVSADIDVYERYVQIQTKGTIDQKALQILTPKEVVYEGGRELELEFHAPVCYYVYGPYGVEDVFCSPSGAVELADECFGVVTGQDGTVLWQRRNRNIRNQIMAIREDAATEERGSLAVCLDTILAFRGVSCNTQALLNRGRSIREILEDNLEDVRFLDLKGCPLDTVLYYLESDIPVLALLEDGEAVLITGLNESQVVIMEPSSGRLYKKGIHDASEWFEENGNSFLLVFWK